ncbi:porin [Alteromonas oceanisediminis]|uniref:porin n=1 Tax=Alteromonas oceanisediminis TaxID=2836180 RepID=UPI001BD9E2E6|nr:porin [Alteromonas oceanisediminis]MBT0587350.1 porin [Alteromonas oceanisediminis]
MMKRILALSLVAAAVSSSVHADVRINGFANLIGGITSSDDTLYGYDDNIGFGEESLFAIQVSGDINDRMTATGQLVARGSDDYEVDFEWAYLTFEATDNTNISAGRFRLPLFRYSASLDVGYSYHWVNAPRSVYSVPFNNLDGLRVDYSNYAGDWEYNLQLSAGTIDNDFTTAGQDANFKGDNVIVLSAEAQYEALKLRGVIGRAKSTVDVPALAPAIGQLRSISPELADLVEFEDDTGEFLGFGVEYDAFDWFVSAEVTSIEATDSYNPDTIAYYATAGIRYGKWTPSLTYEATDADDGPKLLDRVAGFPAPFQGPLTQLLVGIQQSFVEKNDTITAGVRYDYDTNVAFKADVSKYTDDIDESSDATLVRFAVNYVF